ncbi:hypothetical protein GY45DRAFT_1332040 [Cubamyces sp. BRFM 1775]|nr:hypothetical protein GY45DRAFT_1332040 [Cubamyces sp. BRFM 1775]
MPGLSDTYDLGVYRWPLSQCLRLFRQMIQAVEYLHDQNVVHGDICTGNVVLTTERDAQLHKELTAEKIYLIDFETARRLSLPLWKQHVLPLPEARYRRRLKDLAHFDPYSWDVYCLGRLFRYLLEDAYGRRKLPWIVHPYHRWLLSDEKGCMGVCRCRPTARRARQMLTVMIWVAHTSELCEGLVMRIHRFITPLFSRPS